ncbi:glycoprotein glucosyltransferase [Anaeramoeba flamelloides]|uniref:Glycoprotein glucosyltransferase n=1 Tax=Anaeramoeba flamelloides TaxID=1746091 RepID=A0AAV8A272_9EUKA|nr:glycoprotein glucosyltransferase [Anaeramoeba flamelloides]
MLKNHLLILLTLTVLTVINGFSGSIVTVDLRSNWPRSSLLGEASEYLYTISPDLFFKFVGDVAANDEKYSSSEYDQLKGINSFAALHFTSELEFELLNWTLSTHKYSALLESHRQLKLSTHSRSFQCLSSDHFVDFRGKIICNQELLLKLVHGEPTMFDEMYENEKNISPAPVIVPLITTLFKMVFSKSEITKNYEQEYQFERSRIYEFDRTWRNNLFHPGTQKSNDFEPMIFYMKLGAPNLLGWIQTMDTVCKRFYCVFRHNPTLVAPKFPLSGWGVQLRPFGYSMEYGVVDDYNASNSLSSNIYKSIKHDEVGGQRLIKEESQALDQLIGEQQNKQEEDQEIGEQNHKNNDNESKINFKNFGFKTAQKIINSDDPLSSINLISQNLPLLVSNIDSIQLDGSIHQSILKNQRTYLSEEAFNKIYLNGREISVSDFYPDNVAEIMKQEYYKIQEYEKLFKTLNRQQIIKLASLPGQSRKVPRVDLNQNVVWLNDIEKDNLYLNWQKNIRVMLQPIQTGNIIFVRKNLYTIITVCDLSSIDSLILMNKLYYDYQRNAPFRYGFLFSSNEKNKYIANRVENLFLYIKNNVGVRQSFEFISKVVQRSGNGNGFIIDLRIVKKIFLEFLNHDQEILDNVLMDLPFQEEIDKMYAYVQNKEIHEYPLMTINGKIIDNLDVKYNYFPKILQEKKVLTRLIRENKIQSSNENIFNKILSNFNVNEYIDKDIFKITNNYRFSPEEFLEISKQVQYFTNPKIDNRFDVNENLDIKNDFNGVTHWLIINFHKDDYGRQKKIMNWVNELKELIASEKVNSRIGVLYNLEGNFNELDYIILNQEIFGKSIKKESLIYHSDFVRNTLKISNSQSAIVTNGNLFVFNEDGITNFNLKQLELLTKIEKMHSTQKIINLFNDFDINHASSSMGNIYDLFFYLSVDMGYEYQNSIFRNEQYPLNNGIKKSLNDKQAGFVLQKFESQEKINFQFFIILNPIDEQVPKFSKILIEIWKNFNNIEMCVLFNPDANIQNLPIQQFYRYAFDSSIRFDQNGKLLDPDMSVVFTHVPEHITFSLIEDIPDSWLIEKFQAKFDLDNIRFDKIEPKEEIIQARYELTHLLVTGKCFEVEGRHEKYPSGLEIYLGLPNLIKNIQDTLVMTNNGYFQIKANPGFWELSLNSVDQRSSYELTSQNEKFLLISSLRGQNLDLEVSRQLRYKVNENGQENNHPLKKQQRENQINVFITVSGHLDERLSKNMMLSVISNTKNPVKFWFLKNYLSPKFKYILPFMADKYNFEYELVTYKWPKWLNQQKDKNRIMMGFKILFLDVMFPNEIDRIIKIDADQIVRADLKELMEIDLKNNVIAMAPFCDSKKEMEGYRFWKTGYWEEHLQGKPYFMSALYVLDLKKFRERKVGEQYRKNYEYLSHDPNSLANLDQDLPNYLQHQIPIFALPRDWLWCEAWCSDETMETAKTIDICNNPDTKESKLEIAKRSIDEWPKINKEMQDFEMKIIKKKYSKRNKNKVNAEKNIVYEMDEQDILASNYVFD